MEHTIEVGPAHIMHACSYAMSPPFRSIHIPRSMVSSSHLNAKGPHAIPDTRRWSANPSPPIPNSILH